MSDLIDRQAAIDALKDMYKAAERWGEGASDDIIKARAESCMASLVEMKLRIEKLPPAQPDAVEVVRCKDCKYASYEPYEDFVDVYICNYSQWTRSEGGRFPDWYCARAERRQDAEKL